MTAHPIPASAALDTSAGSAAVELAGVRKQYGGVTALADLDLRLAPGEFVALLGPSGCGKTTALRCLAGLERVDAGDIRIDGRDVARVPTNRRDLGMVFQSYSLFPHLSSLANVEYGLRMRGVPGADRRRRALEALDLVGLADRGDRFAHQLSGGQQQRVALARALVTHPRVLLLDEPLSALDAKVRVQLREEIRRIQIELGITTLFVTHDQEEALAVADRVAVMRDGRIEQLGTPEDLYLRPRTAFVADFVGTTNHLPGIVHDGVAEVVGGTRLPLVEEAAAPGDVVVGVRPEDLRLVPVTGSATDGTVVASSFLGSSRRTTVSVGDLLLVVQHDVRTAPAVGERVGLAFVGAPVAVRRTTP